MAVAHEREVRHDQSATVTRADAAHVVNDVVEGHWQRAVMALKDHPEGVANEDHFHAGTRDHFGKAGVVSGEGGKLFTTLFHFLERR